MWRRYSRAEVDLFASEETTHCPLWFALTPTALLGLDAMVDAMVQAWPNLCLYSFLLKI